MIFLRDLEKYILDHKDNLTQIDITIKLDADSDTLYVQKTKETYVYEDEEEAEAKVDEVRSNPGFAGIDRGHKDAKINKAGEETAPETWTVKAKLNHIF